MGDDSSVKQDRIRVNLTPVMRRYLDDISAVLGLSDTQLSTLGLALGLRALHMSVKPIDDLLSEAVTKRLSNEAQGFVGDASLLGLNLKLNN
jgi:hypothetical protein